MEATLREMEAAFRKLVAEPGQAVMLLEEIFSMMQAEGPADNPEYDKRAWTRAGAAQSILTSWMCKVYKRQGVAIIEEALAERTGLKGKLEALREGATDLFGPELLAAQHLKENIRTTAEEIAEQVAEDMAFDVGHPTGPASS